MATWPSGLGKGLQSPVPGFDSQRRLSFVVRNVVESDGVEALLKLSESYIQVLTPTPPKSPMAKASALVIVMRLLRSFIPQED